MDKLKLHLLQLAFDQYGFIRPCEGRTLEECFQPDRLEKKMLFYFNCPSGSTHCIAVELGNGAGALKGGNND